MLVLFIGINLVSYYITKVNSELIIDVVLKDNTKMLNTHYKVLRETQIKNAIAAYKSTIGKDRVIEIMALANTATENEKVLLRNELHDIAQKKYQILKEKSVLQYHFFLSNNESFYRAHKPGKYGDDLTDVREDVKYVNETKKPISAFVQGRTAHGFRNVFPMFDKDNNHIGAMEVSYGSDSFQWYLKHISGIHSHFIVDKNIFDAKAWLRDDLVLKYEKSSEHKLYMMTLGSMHTKEECVIENAKKIEPVREEINSKVALGKAFSLYVEHLSESNHIEVISFIPIFGIDKKPLAWMVSYDENSVIESTLLSVFSVRIVLLLLSIVLVYFIYKQVLAKERLKHVSQEQETLLSLFDIGESVLFKWNNDEDWSVSYASQSVEQLLGYEKENFIAGDIAYSQCIHPDDLELVTKEVESGSNTFKDYFIHKPYRIITKENELKWVIDHTMIQRDTDDNITHYIGYISDITELKTQQQLLDDILNSSNNPIFLTDFKDVLLSNYKFKEVVNQPLNNDIINLFVHVDGYLHKDLLRENEDFVSLISRTAPENRIVSLIDKHLEAKAFQISVSKIDKDSKYLVTLSDITAMQEQHLVMSKKAYIDGLTQVYNRNKFNELFEFEFAYAKRYEHPLSISILDIDDFKNFNDTYGHLIGDEVLITMAQTVNINVRDTDIFARWGGEEFVILFKNTSADIAKQVAQKLKLKIQENKHEEAGVITASFGVTEYKSGDTIESIFQRCDEALYFAKENGKNRVEVL
ncbi:diguanylate cyclase [Sulfurimonas sp.]|nr:diguanylate cyclase [Sulfurimonas sp.]